MSKLIYLARGNTRLPKEKQRKFLDSHPAKQLVLPKNIDRSMFGHKYAASEAVSQSMISDRSEEILLNHSCAMSSKVARWSEARRQDAAEFINRYGAHVGAETSAQQQRALESVLECIYSNLKRYQFHFNGVAVGSDLYVVDSLLAQVKEPIQTNKFGEIESSVTYTRMRFSTATLSLAVRGRLDLIECFLVPTSHAMSLSKIEDQFAPLLTVQVKTIDGKFCFRVVDAGDNLNDIEEFTMWLFDQLIDSSKEAIAPQFAARRTNDLRGDLEPDNRGYSSNDQQPELLTAVYGEPDFSPRKLVENGQSLPHQAPLSWPRQLEESALMLAQLQTRSSDLFPQQWQQSGVLPQTRPCDPLLSPTRPSNIHPLQSPSFTAVCSGAVEEEFDYRTAWG